ncbi:MAG: zinc ribbon domain-containing protein, partial [Thermaerobacter sp.]|nr:zinc ribbon domain-containing protein [Thermaerobacter sp.]
MAFAVGARIPCQRLGEWTSIAGIALTKGSEAYTSQTCPHCGHLSRVAGRTYRCRSCGYKAHRDAVG